MKLFDKRSDISIVLAADAPKAVVLAAKDLQRDLRQLSGQEGFPIVTQAEGPAIRVTTGLSGEEEGYTVTVADGGVTILGTDTLGTVYGIYAFSTRCLQVLPVHRLTDLFPPRQEALVLENSSFSSEKRSVRFRGWFVNDEDLLTDFMLTDTHRRLDYPYYQTVMHPQVLDMVLETALRLELNLVIPSTVVDILNPQEEELVRAVTDRGLYISQHHIEPLGVSYFAMENYLADRGLQEDISFITNRSRLEEIWHCYAQKWAVYGDRVVWQLGLRGKGDRAVWQHDANVPMDDASRGKIISDAIFSQHRIIAEALGHRNFHCSTTLWMEGARLYGLGHLPVPENTVVVFSDVGFSQMFGDDFFSVGRQPGQHYGIYYHVGYWVEGPHLTEGCDLRKMAYSYKEACARDTLYYSILNVSNVRPLHSSIWFNAELLKDPQGCDADALLETQLTALYGSHAQAVKALTWQYYDSIADLGSEELQERCQRYNFHYHEYGALPFPLFPATDGYLNWFGRKFLRGNYFTYIANDETTTNAIRQSLPKWEALYDRTLQTETQLSGQCREYFCQFFKYPAFHMLQLTRWYLACRTLIDAEGEALDVAYADADAALQAILEQRTVLEQGKWENWHRGERKIGIAQLVQLTREKYQSLQEQ